MSSYSGTHVRPGLLLPLGALVLTWALVHASLVVFHGLPVFEAGLIGPDSYMRALRVVELYQGGGWFDDTIARANAPFGDTLHWTRPFDLLMLLIALPISAVVGFEQAIHVAGIVISPLFQLLTALALIWALRPILRPGVWFLPVIALFLQPGALAYSVLGRADHHSLLLLVFVIAAGFALRALRDPYDNRAAVLGGAVVGFGIWLSVEFLLVLGACLVAQGLPWLFGERERAAQNKWFALAVSLVLLGALFAERPLANLLEPSYDSVSCVQFFVAVCVLLFWRLAETYERRSAAGSPFLGRTALTLFGVAVMGLLVNAAFPLFIAGPMVGVDPRIEPIWLDLVVEMRPVIPHDRASLGEFIYYLGGGLLVAPFFLKILAEERGTPRFWMLVFIALAGLLLGIVAARHVRFAGYAEIAFVLAFAVVLDRFLHWSGTIRSDLVRGLLRGSIIATLLLGPILVGGAMKESRAEATDAAGQSQAACDLRQLANFLDLHPDWSARPQTILAFLDIGPELLYRTRHAVIGTPYHRNGDGIYDSHRMMTTGDETLARELLAGRGVDLVLLCRSAGERAFFRGGDGSASLYSRLDGGRPPAWLAPVELPPALEGRARLYAVTP